MEARGHSGRKTMANESQAQEDGWTGLEVELASSDAARRAAAAERLALLAEGAAEAAVALAQAAGDEEEIVREWAVAALEACGPPPAGAREALVALLDSPSLDVAYWAATLLGRLGQLAAVADRALARSAADSPHAAVRRRAAWALERIRGG